MAKAHENEKKVQIMQFYLILVPFLLFEWAQKVSCEAETPSKSMEGTGKPTQVNKYVVHLMDSKEEHRNIFVQKCCPEKHVLNENGSCSEFDHEPEISLEQYIRNSTELDDEENLYRFNFQFKQSNLNCETGHLKHLSSHVFSESKKFHFSPSLQLIINVAVSVGMQEEESSLILDSSNFCIDWESNDTISAQACVHDICQVIPEKGGGLPIESSTVFRKNFGNSNRSKYGPSSRSKYCLRKCCPPLQAIDMTNFACVSYNIPWNLSPLMTNSFREEIIISGESSASFPKDDQDQKFDPLPVNWLTGLPDCMQSYEVYADKYDRYYIDSNGALITEQNGKTAKTPPGEYCFDAVVLEATKESFKETPYPQLNFLATNSSNEKKETRALEFYRQMALVCFEKDKSPSELNKIEEENEFSWRNVYTILTGISSIFLLITCLVYTILRKDLNLPGWLQFAYAFTLLLTFTLLTIVQLWTQRIHEISKNLCRALGYGLHFCFLSCFFWLTSMNLDLWLSFRSTLVRGFGKSRGKRRFLEFCAFSIGFPAAVTFLLLVVDSCASTETFSKEWSHFLPTSGIGESACVINIGQKVAQLHYFYGFVGVLLFVNLVIFVGTLISLRNREKETRMAKRQSTSGADYDRLQLFTRLFLIMGILWIFEVISWTLNYFNVNKNIQKIFIFTDCLNASQGIAVFLMFVWKRQTWKQLKKKIKSKFGIRKRPLLGRPSYNCTVSSGGHTTTTNGTSTKSSHLSSTKSTDSRRLNSTSTFTQLDVDCISEEK